MIEVSGFALMFFLAAILAAVLMVLFMDWQYRKLANKVGVMIESINRVCDGELELYRDENNCVRLREADAKQPMGFHKQ